MLASWEILSKSSASPHGARSEARTCVPGSANTTNLLGESVTGAIKFSAAAPT